MLNKYEKEFKEMYEEIKEGKSPLEVIGDSVSLFKPEGIGPLGIVNYIIEYAQKE